MSPITTPSLLLRPFVPDDAPQILALNAEPSTRQWLPSHVYADLDEARAALDFLIACYARPGDPGQGPYVLAVDHRASGQLLGHVGFSPLDDEVEVSFAIAEAARGQGYGVEALVTACDAIGRAYGLPSLLAVTAASNRASRRTLERAGFVHECDEARTFQGTPQKVSRYRRPR
ncbi:GNAT family N-acetyltransferase [uncultured Methylibium sp.]|uniref:GNAT family N-acetyltransferase n=1 Tax=uncultured Methylibium sp. TaxID=381093 RepID=UPI0025EB7130|nr:GNAT family N-acetyltransferase [uncultured Methylibium sp.]